SHQQSRVRLLGGSKLLVDAQMDLHRAALEPDAASLREVFGLWNLPETQQRRVEGPSVLFSTSRHGKLNMIDSDDRHRVAVPALHGRFHVAIQVEEARRERCALTRRRALLRLPDVSTRRASLSRQFASPMRA